MKSTCILEFPIGSPPKYLNQIPESTQQSYLKSSQFTRQYSILVVIQGKIPRVIYHLSLLSLSTAIHLKFCSLYVKSRSWTYYLSFLFIVMKPAFPSSLLYWPWKQFLATFFIHSPVLNGAITDNMSLIICLSCQNLTVVPFFMESTKYPPPSGRSY
jgi:hypothetical protein